MTGILVLLAGWGGAPGAGISRLRSVSHILWSQWVTEHSSPQPHRARSLLLLPSPLPLPTPIPPAPQDSHQAAERHGDQVGLWLGRLLLLLLRWLGRLGWLLRRLGRLGRLGLGRLWLLRRLWPGGDTA